MSSRPIVIHPQVEDDLVEVQAHYAALGAELMHRFEARLDDQIERLDLWPDSGAPLFEDHRRLLVKGFPYMLVYRIGRDRIDVLAVMSTLRNPDVIRDAVISRDT